MTSYWRFIIQINVPYLDRKTFDARLVNRGVKAEEVLLEANKALHSANDRFQVIKLKLNGAKIQDIPMSLKHLLESVRLLGFCLDSRLGWITCCSGLHDIVKGRQLFRKLAPAIFADHFIKIYHALFHRHVEYRVIFWWHASACTDISLIHKRALWVLALAN